MEIAYSNGEDDVQSGLMGTFSHSSEFDELRYRMDVDSGKIKELQSLKPTDTDEDLNRQHDYLDSNARQPITAEYDNHYNVTSSMTKVRVWFNLIVLSLSFLLLFTAYASFENLQSSINYEEGIGTSGLASLYGMIIVASLFIVPVLLSRFRIKWIIVGSIICYAAFIATGFYASWATVIPASVVVGIGAAHLWAAQQNYTKTLAERYAVITHTNRNDAINLFFGVFYSIVSSSNVFGNLLSSVILRREKVDQAFGHLSPQSNYTNDSDVIQYANVFTENSYDRIINTTATYTIHIINTTRTITNIYTSNIISAVNNLNTTINNTINTIDNSLFDDTTPTIPCGIDFCNVDMPNDTATLLRPPQNQITFFTITCLCIIGAAAFLSGLFLTSTPVTFSGKNSWQLTRIVLQHLVGSRDQQLLAIPTLFKGMMQGYAGGDITIAFVSCPYGVENVGFVMIANGAVAATFSVILGRVSKYTGWLPLLVLAFISHMSVNITFLIWKPVPDQMFVMHILVALMALDSTIYALALSTMHSVYFKNTTAALPCLQVLTSLGTVVSFAYSSRVCMIYKTLTMMTLATLSLTCVAIFFRKHRSRDHNLMESQEPTNQNDTSLNSK